MGIIKMANERRKTIKTEELIKKLEDPETKTINAHEIARVILRLCRKSDYQGVRKLEKAYVKGTLAVKKRLKPEDAKRIVKKNLYCAGRLADIVKACKYEASGQILGIDQDIEKPGRTSDFVRAAIGYVPRIAYGESCDSHWGA